MKSDEVKRRAFAMPLTNPSYPPGPYRFVDREFLIITYKTDLDALRAVVPGPLEVAEPLVKFEFHPHAGLDRLRRLYGIRAGHTGHLPGRARQLCPRHVSRRDRKSVV